MAATYLVSGLFAFNVLAADELGWFSTPIRVSKSNRDLKVTLDAELTTHVVVTDREGTSQNSYYRLPSSGQMQTTQLGLGTEVYNLIQRYDPGHIWQLSHTSISENGSSVVLVNLRRSLDFGRTWDTMQIRTPAQALHEGAVKCNAADDCMFIGQAQIGLGQTFQPRVSHWNGIGWTPVADIFTTETVATSEMVLPTGIKNQYLVYYVNQNFLNFTALTVGSADLRGRLITFNDDGSTNWNSRAAAATDLLVMGGIRNVMLNLSAVAGPGLFSYGGLSLNLVAGGSPSGERWAWSTNRGLQDSYENILVAHASSTNKWDKNIGKISDPSYDLAAANIAYDTAQNRFYLFYYKITYANGVNPDGTVAGANGSYSVCYRSVASGAGSSGLQSAAEICPVQNRPGKWLGANTNEIMGDGTGYDIGAVHNGHIAISFEDNCQTGDATCTLAVFKNF